MNFFTQLFTSFDINPSTLSGAIDIIAIRQPNNTVKTSPFYVRFGKMKVFMAHKK